jgi:hypothetical protein
MTIFSLITTKMNFISKAALKNFWDFLYELQLVKYCQEEIYWK